MRRDISKEVVVGIILAFEGAYFSANAFIQSQAFKRIDAVETVLWELKDQVSDLRSLVAGTCSKKNISNANANMKGIQNGNFTGHGKCRVRV